MTDQIASRPISNPVQVREQNSSSDKSGQPKLLLPAEDLLRAISGLQSVFIQENDAEKAFRFLLDKLVKLSGSQFGLICQVYSEPEEHHIAVTAYSSCLKKDHIRQIYGSDNALEYSNSCHDPFLNRVIHDGKAIVQNNLRGVGHKAVPIDSMTCMPLKVGDKLIGAISLGNRPEGYPENLPENLQPLLNHVSNIVEAYRQRERRLWLEQKRLSDNRMLRGILDNALEAILAIDSDGRVILFNPAAENMFGWKQQEILGKNALTKLFPNYHRSPSERRRAIKSGDSKYVASRYTSKGKHRDGNVFDIEIAASEVMLDGKSMYIAFMRDRTRHLAGIKALEAAKEAAEAANQAKSRFVATVSHEIRTPLSAITGGLNLLKKAELNEDEQKYLRVTKDSALILTELIDDLLDFAKIEDGQKELTEENGYPAQLLDSIISMVAQRSDSAGAELASFVDPNTPYQAYFDVGRVRQILINLIVNAVKFSRGGHVQAEVIKLSGNRLRFEIQDDGIGIPMADISRVFKAFERIESGEKSNKNGTGLGLAISKRLVEQIGGEIGCDSSIGKGSTFWFTLPYQTVKNSPKRPGATGEFSQLKVGVFENSKAWLKTCLVRQLSAWSINTTEIKTGQNLTTDKYDLLFVEAESLIDAKLTQSLQSYVAKGGKIVTVGGGTGEVAIALATEQPKWVISEPVLQEELWNSLKLTIEDRPEGPSSHHQYPDNQDEPTFTRGQRILLAEDSAANRMVNSAILKRMGFIVDAVANGLEAAYAVQSLPYDLVLMDVDMPTMNGIAATRKIRESGGAHANVIIIGISAHAKKTVGKECLEAGMNEYLMKPVHRPEMLEVFSRYLHTNHTAQSDLPLSPAAKTVKFLDLAAIDQLARDAGSEALAPMFRTFIDEMADRIKKMRAAVEGADTALIGSESHALKSSAATFGFQEVATLAAQINSAIHDGELTTVAASFQMLETAAKSSVEAIRNEWHRLIPQD